MPTLLLGNHDRSIYTRSRDGFDISRSFRCCWSGHHSAPPALSSSEIRARISAGQHGIWSDYCFISGRSNHNRVLAACTTRLGRGCYVCCRRVACLAFGRHVRRNTPSAAWLSCHSAIGSVDQPMVLREPLGCSWADLQDEPFLPSHGLHNES